MSANKMYLNALTFGLLASLTACGGADPLPPAAVVPPPAVVAPTAPVTLPPPQNLGGDYVLTNVVPWLQSSYGNIELQDAVTLQATSTTITIPAGNYTWDQMYRDHLVPLATACNCMVQGLPNQTTISPFGPCPHMRRSR